jgi:hypothetical protein
MTPLCARRVHDAPRLQLRSIYTWASSRTTRDFRSRCSSPAGWTRIVASASSTLPWRHQQLRHRSSLEAALSARRATQWRIDGSWRRSAVDQRRTLRATYAVLPREFMSELKDPSHEASSQTKQNPGEELAALPFSLSRRATDDCRRLKTILPVP